MAQTNFPSVVGAKTLAEVIDSVENMRKEVEFVFNSLDGDNFVAGTLNMGNKNIINVNSIQIADPGVSEGVLWMNGNGWKIHESPDAGGNLKGNLQIFLNNTRKFTFTTDGQLKILGNASNLKFEASTHSYMEFMLGTDRAGWFGYGSSGSTSLQAKNELGDIALNPKSTSDYVVMGGKMRAANLAAGQAIITPVANDVASKFVSFGKTFSTPPVITLGVNSTVPMSEVKMVSFDTVTTTGFTLNIYRTNNTSTEVHWMAYDPV